MCVVCVCDAHGQHVTHGSAYMSVIERMCRVGQNLIYTPYMTVYLAFFLPKRQYIHRIYMVLANPTYMSLSVYGSACTPSSVNVCHRVKESLLS